MRLLRTALWIAFAVGATALAQPRAACAEMIHVALLPVSINSSLAETGHLSAGLADMVAARLEQTGRIAIIRLDAPAASREQAIASGKEAGADFVLFGSYTQFGDGASLDLRCAPVAEAGDDEPRRVFIQAGSASEIIPKLSVLSESVARYLVGAADSPGPVVDAESPATEASEAASLADIERRIEALERVIFAPPAASDLTAE